MKKNRILFGLWLIVLIILIGMVVVRFFDKTVDFFITPEFSDLEVELIGSAFFGLIIALSIYYHQKTTEEVRNKDRSKRNFEKITVPRLKIAFERPNGLNLIKAKNNRAYYDNSKINNLHDAIENELGSIVDFIDNNEKNQLAVDLKKFYDDVEMGYVLGEGLDLLLSKMARNKAVSDEVIIYTKGLRYAKFNEEELKDQLYQSHDGLYDIYEKFYSGNPESDRIQRYQRDFIELDLQMKNYIAKLREDLSALMKRLLD